MPSKNPRINFDITDNDMIDDTPLQHEDIDFDEGLPDEQIPEIQAPSVVEKPKPNRRDIFDVVDVEDMPDNLAVVPNELKDQITESPKMVKPPTPEPPTKTEPLPELEPEPLVEKPRGKLTKSGKPRKPMSEAHKLKLAEARKKAMLVKKQKAEERKAQKELEREERELLKQKKVKDVQKLKEEVNTEKPPSKQPVGITTFTKEDLEKAQYDAILKYDRLRKQQKAEKKKVQQEERERKELMDKLKPQNTGYRSRNANGRFNNPYDMCY